MVRKPDLVEYLEKIRNQVCSRCVERPPGGPPCFPLGKLCGIEMHLPQLVDAIHQVKGNRIDPYLDHNRRTICEHCALRSTCDCPCPMDYLAVLLVEAVESVETRYEEVAAGSE